jgi:hypothetical protein
VAEVGETARHRRMAKLLARTEALYQYAVLMTDEEGDPAYVFRTLEAVYPPIIEIALGKSATDQYLEVVATAKQQSNVDAASTCRAAVPFLHDLINIAMENELKAAQQAKLIAAKC